MNSQTPQGAEIPYNLSVDWKFHPRFVVAPMHLKLEGAVFADLVGLVEREINNPARKSYGHRLAGVIRDGEQIETTGHLPQRFTSFLCGLAQHYILRLGEANGVALQPAVQTVFRDAWIVLSRAGDYNPVHKHSAQLSGIVYVKVPPQVADPATMDGKLHFLFGQHQESNLDLLGDRLIIPAVGDLYLFPSWMQHVVYPFQGPGERISFAFNLLAQDISPA
jgi:Putative 2OG-Fe(II) oxygenase